MFSAILITLGNAIAFAISQSKTTAEVVRITNENRNITLDVKQKNITLQKTTEELRILQGQYAAMLPRVRERYVKIPLKLYLDLFRYPKQATVHHGNSLAKQPPLCYPITSNDVLKVCNQVPVYKFDDGQHFPMLVDYQRIWGSTRYDRDLDRALQHDERYKESGAEGQEYEDGTILALVIESSGGRPPEDVRLDYTKIVPRFGVACESDLIFDQTWLKKVSHTSIVKSESIVWRSEIDSRSGILFPVYLSLNVRSLMPAYDEEVQVTKWPICIPNMIRYRDPLTHSEMKPINVRKPYPLTHQIQYQGFLEDLG